MIDYSTLESFENELGMYVRLLNGIKNGKLCFMIVYGRDFFIRRVTFYNRGYAYDYFNNVVDKLKRYV